MHWCANRSRTSINPTGFCGFESRPLRLFLSLGIQLVKKVPKKTVVAHDIVKRWGGDKAVMHEGFVAVPTAFLMYLPSLGEYGLTPAEALFIIEIMAFKWDARSPHPSYKTLAARMGVSLAYVRKLARSLEQKKLIIRMSISPYHK